MISLATYSSRTSANVCGLSGRTFSTLSDNEFVVQPADVIFVSAMQCDRQLLECSFSGVSSVRELLAVAGRALGNVTGLVTLHFRNRDRGCSLRRAVRFHPSIIGKTKSAILKNEKYIFWCFPAISGASV